MRYLSMYGVDGFRTFLGMVTGKIAYTAEKIPKIDPEILSERDFSRRLQELIAPYTDNHPKLKEILPIISSDIGNVHEVNSKLCIWRPKTHLSDLGERLIAGFTEAFTPKELEQPLNFIADFYDSGTAFTNAFSIEEKKIFIPSYLIPSIVLPKIDDRTKIFQINQDEKSWADTRKEFMKHTSIRFDGVNFIRVLGHMATIIQALYETERKRIRFFNDPVGLALPADDLEFILAGYYLAQSDLPIKNIYCISSEHRMLHNFLDKGEFSLSIVKPRASFMISLYRILFEASRGSVNKVARWKNELKTKGVFRVDTKTLENLKATFKPIFTTKTLLDSVRETFSQDTDLTSTKLSLGAYACSKESQEQILAFDRENPDLEKFEQSIPIISVEQFLNSYK